MVWPSLYEGFGLPVLEAMACGTPVVTSRTSSIPEVGGEAAIYFDPTDEEEMIESVRRLLRDNALSEEMEVDGLAQAARFSWEQTATRTEAVYDDVLARGPGVGRGPSAAGPHPRPQRRLPRTAAPLWRKL